MYQLSFWRKKQISRESTNIVYLRQLGCISIPIFHMLVVLIRSIHLHFHGNEMLIYLSSHNGRWVDILVHFLAWATPSSITVYKNVFAFRFGFLFYLFPIQTIGPPNAIIICFISYILTQ